MNLYELLESSARAHGERLAVIDGERRITYAELSERVGAVRHELQREGVGRAQRVGLLADNSVDYITASFAILAAGAAVSPISTELSDRERWAIVEKVNLNAIVHDPAIGLGPSPVVPEPGSAAAETPLCCGMRLRRLDGAADAPPDFAKTNPAFLRFTSGTTGDSKGVVLSHETIAERIAAANCALNVGPGDTVLWVLSMAYHFTVSIVSYLANGATVVLGHSFPPGAMLEACRRHRVTLIYASPMQYRLMAAGAGKSAALPDVRMAISTTAALAPAVAEAFHAKFGLPLTECYGIIEAGLPFINVDAPWERRGSVGRILPGYDARLLNDGREGDVGDVGEICLRGPGFLDAYYAPWRPREEIFDDGWFHTGDLGCFDADGFLRIVGRRKEIVNVGGMKVFPMEVESALEAHPDVAESRVSGQPHPQLGEILCAMVVARPGAEITEADLMRHCQERLATYEIPARIEFVDTVPRTASGKIQRW
jgi:long-chain acyl-CoA synthetase